MPQLLDPRLIVEEEAPPLQLEMPRVYRRPPMPLPPRRKKAVRKLVREAREASARSDWPAFGLAYGELTVLFQPMIHWGLSCWEYLLSIEGCRFVCRLPEEKKYCRGDYRAFSEKEYSSLVYKAFRNCLLAYSSQQEPGDFSLFIRKNFWTELLERYKAMAQPPDPRQRILTGYSYLRCVPYRFLNDLHHARVTKIISRLPEKMRRVVELYYLRFFTKEAAQEVLEINHLAFRRRQMAALRSISEEDRLSYVLLRQIERY